MRTHIARMCISERSLLSLIVSSPFAYAVQLRHLFELSRLLRVSLRLGANCTEVSPLRSQREVQMYPRACEKPHRARRKQRTI
jgi:hypothetical protein